jgi:hypothetical protein
MLGPWRPGWCRAAVLALVLAVFLAWYALVRQRIGAGGLLGVLGVLAITGIVLPAVVPRGANLAALATCGAVFAATSARRSALAAVHGAAVVVLVLEPTVVLVFPACGLDGAEQHARGGPPGPGPRARAGDSLPRPRFLRQGGLPALALTALAASCFVVGLVMDRFDAAHPGPSHLAYAVDADTGGPCGPAWTADRKTGRCPT